MKLVMIRRSVVNSLEKGSGGCVSTRKLLMLFIVCRMDEGNVWFVDCRQAES